MLEALTMRARFAIGSSSSDTAELPAREGRERESEGKREGREVVREERGKEEWSGSEGGKKKEMGGRGKGSESEGKGVRR
jgi:hypothetical protein